MIKVKGYTIYKVEYHYSPPSQFSHSIYWRRVMVACKGGEEEAKYLVREYQKRNHYPGEVDEFAAISFLGSVEYIDTPVILNTFSRGAIVVASQYSVKYAYPPDSGVSRCTIPRRIWVVHNGGDFSPDRLKEDESIRWFFSPLGYGRSPYEPELTLEDVFCLDILDPQAILEFFPS